MDFMRRGTVAVAVAVAVALSLVACSKSTPKALPSRSAGVTTTVSPSPPTPDPCVLLTAQQVTSVLGGTVAAPQHADLFGSPVCNLAVTGSHLAPALTVQLVVLLNYDRTRFQTFKSPGGDGVPVAGVGEDALYEPSRGGVVFLKGNTVVLVVFVWPSSPAPDPASYKPQAVALATDAAGAL